MSETEHNQSEPLGELALQTLAMPKDTNANGDIFGGWLVGQMDLAAGIASKEVAKGRSATVAIKDVTFIRPVRVGATVSCYARVVKTGHTSMHIQVEVWTTNHLGHKDMQKVSEGLFVFVAIDDTGKPRPLPDAR